MFSTVSDPVSAVKLLATLEGVLSPGTMEKTRRGLTAAMRGADNAGAMRGDDNARCAPAARADFLSKLNQ